MSQVYNHASEVLTKFLLKKGGIKTLAYDDKISHKKSVFALVVQTLKCTYKHK